MATDGRYKFSVGLDTSQLKGDVDAAKRQFDNLVDGAKKAGKGVDEGLSGASKGLGQIPQAAQGATQSFQGLNVATQQIARELPAATMGLNTFFLAISNNLPVFTDQVKAARSAGASFTTIIKQVATSLFSWQTALVLAITALSMYSDKIFAFIKRIFTGKGAVDALAQAQERLNEVKHKGVVEAQEEVITLQLTANAAKNTSLSMEERTRAIKKLRDEYPEYLQNLTDEQLLNGEVGTSIEKLIEKIVRLAQAREALNRLVENTKNRKTLEGAGDAWKQFEVAAKAYKDAGETKVLTDEFYSVAQGKNVNTTTNTPEYNALIDAEKALRKSLKKMGDEGKDIAEMVKEEFDGSFYQYFKSMEEESKKLEDLAQPLVIDDGSNKKDPKDTAKLLAAEQARLRREVDQAEIDAMKDGTAKKLAQIGLEYQQRAEEINKQEDKLRALQSGKLTGEQTEQFTALRQANKAKQDRAIDDLLKDDSKIAKQDLEQADKEVEELFNRRREDMEQYLIDYGNWQEKIQATTERYQRKINEAETEGERMSLQAELDVLLANYAVEAENFGQQIVGKTATEIAQMIKETEDLIKEKDQAFQAMDSTNTQDAQKLRQEIAKLKAQLAKLKEGTDKAKDSATSKDWDVSIEVFQNISKAATDAAEGLEPFDSSISSILRTIAMLSGTAINLITSIKAVGKAFSDTAKEVSAMEKTSVILAVIGAVVQVISALWQVFSQGESSMDRTIRQFGELNEELAKMRRLAEIDSVEDTIFGVFGYTNALNNLRVLNDAMKNYNESTKNLLERGKEEQMLNSWGEQTFNFREESAEYVGGANLTKKDYTWGSVADSIRNMQVQTRHATVFRVAQYQSLGELLPELFGPNGELDLEMLKELQDSDLYNKITAENRQLIDDLVDNWELYEEALESVKDYLSGIFGDLTDDAMDAIANAFRNGTDAALEFSQISAQVLETFINDMLKTDLLEDKFRGFQEEILGILGSDMSQADKQAALIDTMGRVNEALKTANEEAQLVMESAQAAAEAQGIDLYKSEEDLSASSRGIAQASQDSVDELNGRFTAIQGHTNSIMDDCKTLTANSGRILQLLTEVRDNTSDLADIKDDIRSLRDTVDTMASRGVKMV